MKICLFVLTECRNVTDGHTHTDTQIHRQTTHDDIGRACIASRGKKLTKKQTMIATSTGDLTQNIASCLERNVVMLFKRRIKHCLALLLPVYSKVLRAV